MPTPDPRGAYEARLRAREAAATADEARADLCSNLRLAVFLAALLTLGLALADVLPVHVLWPLLALFALLVGLHARAAGRARGARRAAAFYADGLARLDGAWTGRGRSGSELAPEGHDYAEDLDLFGRGSLFERLCLARTQAGAQRLADWLLAPADPDVVRARQVAVAELAPRLDLRETLAVEQGDARTALDRGAAEAWGAAPARLGGRGEPWLHAAGAAASLGLLVAWQAGVLSPLPMLVAMLLQYGLAARRRTVVDQVLGAADPPAQDLVLVGHLLEILERTEFAAPYLAGRLGGLLAAGDRPSAHIRRLGRLLDAVDARRNQIVLPVAWLLSLGTQLAFAVERWRARHGVALARWLDAVAEVEAVASLAGYAFEHPGDPFPEIVADGALYHGDGLAHPLLPADRAVRNDVHLGLGADEVRALLVSGSNMSGKSTLLRTVGVNAVLAFAGAPVRARALRLAPLAVGASIRIHDSLQDGASRFYAEIERLKRIVDLSAGPRPALFLLDEILHGTNSHDRSVGAAAVVRTLVAHGSLGLVTTHDLALASMEDRAQGRLRNVHFEDQVEDGRMAFDYTLRPGVVQRSNALALMRMVGLKVEPQES
jgi:hypothetical protein